ncbi:MAG: hypothetical protein LBK66_10190 [Spirochaetaceae bacterium]|nr:hypothetical protein [Spirochaetaceae bacterium]
MRTGWPALAGGKTLNAAIELNAAPPPARGGKTLTRSVCASMANGKTLNAAIESNAAPPPTSGGKTLARNACASMANGCFFL